MIGRAPSPNVIVVGGINMDIGGRAFGPMVPSDSNPGVIKTNPGGVGRNIAHNISRLGTKTKLLTALGDDAFADVLKKHCASVGLDISEAQTVPNASTSMCLYLEDPDGSLQLAVCDASIAEEISPRYLEKKRELFEKATIVMMDGNLPEVTLKWITENVTCPIFADPVSVTKGQKLKALLPYIDTIKPNLREAEMLSDMPITDEASLFAAAKKLLDAGVKHVYISLGPDGLLAADADSIKLYPNLPARFVNSNGCGDAMTAGLIKARILGLSPEETARFALAAAAFTLESEESVSMQLNTFAILERIRS